jgi:hypothetical protein
MARAHMRAGRCTDGRGRARAPGRSRRAGSERGPWKHPGVGWVVKQWRTEAARDQAERDARRARRAADRAAAGVAAQLEALEALEHFGVELHASVGRRRAAGPPVTPTAANGAAPGPRRRTARATLRDGALAELFRATEPRQPGSAPPAV